MMGMTAPWIFILLFYRGCFAHLSMDDDEMLKPIDQSYTSKNFQIDNTLKTILDIKKAVKEALVFLSGPYLAGQPLNKVGANYQSQILSEKTQGNGSSNIETGTKPISEKKGHVLPSSPSSNSSKHIVDILNADTRVKDPLQVINTESNKQTEDAPNLNVVAKHGQAVKISKTDPGKQTDETNHLPINGNNYHYNERTIENVEKNIVKSNLTAAYPLDYTSRNQTYKVKIGTNHLKTSDPTSGKTLSQDSSGAVPKFMLLSTIQQTSNEFSKLNLKTNLQHGSYLPSNTETGISAAHMSSGSGPTNIVQSPKQSIKEVHVIERGSHTPGSLGATATGEQAQKTTLISYDSRGAGNKISNFQVSNDGSSSVLNSYGKKKNCTITSGSPTESNSVSKRNFEQFFGIKNKFSDTAIPNQLLSPNTETSSVGFENEALVKPDIPSTKLIRESSVSDQEHNYGRKVNEILGNPFDKADLNRKRLEGTNLAKQNTFSYIPSKKIDIVSGQDEIIQKIGGHMYQNVPRNSNDRQHTDGKTMSNSYDMQFMLNKNEGNKRSNGHHDSRHVFEHKKHNYLPQTTSQNNDVHHNKADKNAVIQKHSLHSKSLASTERQNNDLHVQQPSSKSHKIFDSYHHSNAQNSPPETVSSQNNGSFLQSDHHASNGHLLVNSGHTGQGFQKDHSNVQHEVINQRRSNQQIYVETHSNVHNTPTKNNQHDPSHQNTHRHTDNLQHLNTVHHYLGGHGRQNVLHAQQQSDHPISEHKKSHAGVGTSEGNINANEQVLRLDFRISSSNDSPHPFSLSNIDILPTFKSLTIGQKTEKPFIHQKIFSIGIRNSAFNDHHGGSNAHHQNTVETKGNHMTEKALKTSLQKKLKTSSTEQAGPTQTKNVPRNSLLILNGTSESETADKLKGNGNKLNVNIQPQNDLHSRNSFKDYGLPSGSALRVLSKTFGPKPSNNAITEKHTAQHAGTEDRKKTASERNKKNFDPINFPTTNVILVTNTKQEPGNTDYNNKLHEENNGKKYSGMKIGNPLAIKKKPAVVFSINNPQIANNNKDMANLKDSTRLFKSRNTSLPEISTHEGTVSSSGMFETILKSKSNTKTANLEIVNGEHMHSNKQAVATRKDYSHPSWRRESHSAGSGLASTRKIENSINTQSQVVDSNSKIINNRMYLHQPQVTPKNPENRTIKRLEKLKRLEHARESRQDMLPLGSGLQNSGNLHESNQIERIENAIETRSKVTISTGNKHSPSKTKSAGDNPRSGNEVYEAVIVDPKGNTNNFVATESSNTNKPKVFPLNKAKNLQENHLDQVNRFDRAFGDGHNADNHQTHNIVTTARTNKHETVGSYSNTKSVVRRKQKKKHQPSQNHHLDRIERIEHAFESRPELLPKTSRRTKLANAGTQAERLRRLEHAVETRQESISRIPNKSRNVGTQAERLRRLEHAVESRSEAEFPSMTNKAYYDPKNKEGVHLKILPKNEIKSFVSKNSTTNVATKRQGNNTETSSNHVETSVENVTKTLHKPNNTMPHKIDITTPNTLNTASPITADIRNNNSKINVVETGNKTRLNITTTVNNDSTNKRPSPRTKSVADLIRDAERLEHALETHPISPNNNLYGDVGEIEAPEITDYGISSTKRNHNIQMSQAGNIERLEYLLDGRGESALPVVVASKILKSVPFSNKRYYNLEHLENAIEMGDVLPNIARSKRRYKNDLNAMPYTEQIEYAVDTRPLEPSSSVPDLDQLGVRSGQNIPPHAESTVTNTSRGNVSSNDKTNSTIRNLESTSNSTTRHKTIANLSKVSVNNSSTVSTNSKLSENALENMQGNNETTKAVNGSKIFGIVTVENVEYEAETIKVRIDKPNKNSTEISSTALPQVTTTLVGETEEEAPEIAEVQNQNYLAPSTHKAPEKGKTNSYKHKQFPEVSKMNQQGTNSNQRRQKRSFSQNGVIGKLPSNAVHIIDASNKSPYHRIDSHGENMNVNKIPKSDSKFTIRLILSEPIKPVVPSGSTASHKNIFSQNEQQPTDVIYSNLNKNENKKSPENAQKMRNHRKRHISDNDNLYSEIGKSLSNRLTIFSASEGASGHKQGLNIPNPLYIKQEMSDAALSQMFPNFYQDHHLTGVAAENSNKAIHQQNHQDRTNDLHNALFMPPKVDYIVPESGQPFEQNNGNVLVLPELSYINSMQRENIFDYQFSGHNRRLDVNPGQFPDAVTEQFFNSRTPDYQDFQNVINAFTFSNVRIVPGGAIINGDFYRYDELPKGLQNYYDSKIKLEHTKLSIGDIENVLSDYADHKGSISQGLSGDIPIIDFIKGNDGSQFPMHMQPPYSNGFDRFSDPQLYGLFRQQTQSHVPPKSGEYKRTRSSASLSNQQINDRHYTKNLNSFVLSGHIQRHTEEMNGTPDKAGSKLTSLTEFLVDGHPTDTNYLSSRFPYVDKSKHFPINGQFIENSSKHFDKPLKIMETVTNELGMTKPPQITSQSFITNSPTTPDIHMTTTDNLNDIDNIIELAGIFSLPKIRLNPRKPVTKSKLVRNEFKTTNANVVKSTASPIMTIRQNREDSNFQPNDLYYLANKNKNQKLELNNRENQKTRHNSNSADQSAHKLSTLKDSFINQLQQFEVLSTKNAKNTYMDNHLGLFGNAKRKEADSAPGFSLIGTVKPNIDLVPTPNIPLRLSGQYNLETILNNILKYPLKREKNMIV